MSIIIWSTRAGTATAKPMNAAVTLATRQYTTTSNVAIMSPPHITGITQGLWIKVPIVVIKE
jgi:hypothetical protein